MAVLFSGCGGQAVLEADDARPAEITDAGAGPVTSIYAAEGGAHTQTAAIPTGGLGALAGGSNGGSFNTNRGGSEFAGAFADSFGDALNAEQLSRATAACGEPPWVFVGTVRNSRDLGGVPTLRGKVACDKVYRGSQLNTLSSLGCSEFANLSIRTVIDLRTDTEATGAPADPCVGQQARIIRAPMPTPYSLSPQDYISDLHAHESLISAFRALSDPSAYPIYFHCIYGRDRTGVLAALILRLLGTADMTIMSEYMRTVEAGMGAAPDSLTATLAEIDRLGGAEVFLKSIGVSPEAIAELRATITVPP
ncbi:MAG TPA: tyrosine-protein phosphatase [Polyangiaceae bacterium]